MKKNKIILLILLFVGIVLVITGAIHLIHTDHAHLKDEIEIGLGIAFLLAFIFSFFIKKKKK